MSDLTLKVLSISDAVPAWAGPAFEVSCASQAGSARQFDAVVFHAPDDSALDALLRRADLQQAAFDSAVVVVAPTAELGSELALLKQGVQDIVRGLDNAAMGRLLWHAVERKRLEKAARHAYATDLTTGLPHQAQLIEHMSQLLALRQRDPAPMVLIVLRIEGLPVTAARLGVEAANILRRKVAVRLRSGLRASDVVAATGPESFGVLLGHIEAIADGERVASKLVQSLNQPFQVAGQSCSVAVAAGLALFPEHGTDAGTLLQRASAQAVGAVAMGREGFAAHTERAPMRAANDDDSRLT